MHTTPMPKNVFEAATLPLRRYARFSGRSSRMEFWSFVVAVNVLQFLLLRTIPSISWPIMLVLVVPSQAVLVRRLHDIDRSGWWALAIPLLVVPLFVLYALTLFTLDSEDGKAIFIAIGILLLILIIMGVRLVVWACRKGSPGTNRFGSAPGMAGDARPILK